MIGEVFTTLVATTAWEPKKLIVFSKNAYFNVSAVLFCKQFSAYAVYIDRCAFL